MNKKLTLVFNGLLIFIGIYWGIVGNHAYAAEIFAFVAAMNTIPWSGKE